MNVLPKISDYSILWKYVFIFQVRPQIDFILKVLHKKQILNMLIHYKQSFKYTFFALGSDDLTFRKAFRAT